MKPSRGGKMEFDILERTYEGMHVVHKNAIGCRRRFSLVIADSECLPLSYKI
jgi:hypothetical protein